MCLLPLALECALRFSLIGMNSNTSNNSKTWLITGASSGFGLALAKAALAAGERVVGTARNTGRFADLTQRYGDTFLAVRHDVRDRDGAQAVVDAAVSKFGKVDVLVNNAGVGQLGTAEEVSDAQLLDMIEQHLLGPAAFVRAVLPNMRKTGSGHIVQISSQGGRRSFAGVGSYSAGKFALEGWSEALSYEVAPFGIKVLIVEPSRFRTGFNRPDVLLTADQSTTYDSVVGAVRKDMTTSDGVQEGDPDRAATVIRKVLDMDDAPLRLPLGAEAVRNMTVLHKTGLADTQKWADLSASADFPGVAASQRAFQAE